MDKILSYLPENVHVRFGWEHDPEYYGAMPHTEYKVICIPKNWLKHGKRGTYDEWSIKETYKKKLSKEFGEEFLHKTERLELIEWNQLETVCQILKSANNIGFDLISAIQNVNDKDVIYYSPYAIK